MQGIMPTLMCLVTRQTCILWTRPWTVLWLVERGVVTAAHAGARLQVERWVFSTRWEMTRPVGAVSMILPTGFAGILSRR
ncbi:hypothetical protein CHH27_06670 [Labrenzia sp. VG12]|nr:hypothetical protein CHH27_06670 [Labrenzia sp. VG12]